MRNAYVATLVLSLLAACQATPEKIATWKGTQKGPQKLRDVVTDSGADPQLRALAAAALIEIGMTQEAAHDLAQIDAAAHAKVVHELIAPLAALLGDSATRAVQTTPHELAAKDALFDARADAAPADRARIDDLLLKWTTVDLAARASLGGQSTEKILRAMGPPAAAALVPLVHAGPDLRIAARMIGELGDPTAVAHASQALAKLARSGPGGIHTVGEAILEALGLLGGPDATALLLEIAAQGNEQARETALLALARGHISAGDEKALSGALAIAADAHAPGRVREAAFLVTEKIGPAAVGGLLKLFSDKDSLVRFRAVEAALAAGGAAAIPRVLAALPEAPVMKSEDLDSFVVHDLQLIGKDAMPALLAAAAKPTPGHLAQVAAIRAIGQLGRAADRAKLEAAAGSSTGAVALSPPSELTAEVGKAEAQMAKRK